MLLLVLLWLLSLHVTFSSIVIVCNSIRIMITMIIVYIMVYPRGPRKAPHAPWEESGPVVNLVALVPWGPLRSLEVPRVPWVPGVPWDPWSLGPEVLGSFCLKNPWWNRNPRPQPQKSSKLVFLIAFSQYYVYIDWLSGALVGVGGSDFIGYKWRCV